MFDKPLSFVLQTQVLDISFSYDAFYCERKSQEMQRISNFQKIQTKSIFVRLKQTV